MIDRGIGKDPARGSEGKDGEVEIDFVICYLLLK